MRRSTTASSGSFWSSGYGRCGSVNPAEPDTDVGPLINERALEKNLAYVELGKTEGRLLIGGRPQRAVRGYFIEPTVFADVRPAQARIAQEEILGPVLAVVSSADGFEQALAIANDTEFGLTGAVYTRDPARILQAQNDFFVGNLYINRKCTGALVGVHPFGGFNLRRDRLQGRRPGLPAALHASKNDVTQSVM